MRRRYLYQDGGEQKGLLPANGLIPPGLFLDPRIFDSRYNRRPVDVPVPERDVRKVVPPMMSASLLPSMVVDPKGLANLLAEKTNEAKRKVQSVPIARLPNPSVGDWRNDKDVHVSNGDIAIQNGIPGKAAVEAKMAQGFSEQAKLQGDLVRLGYSPHVAAAFAHKGKSGLEPYIQKQLNALAEGDYRVTMHPDYDPQIPISDQQHLNWDNSLRTSLFRGRNMFLDTGNPVGDFIAETITAPGRAAMNLTMDWDKQYVQPGWGAGTLNFVGDVVSILPEMALTPGKQVANRLIKRGLPESSLLLEKSLGRPGVSVATRKLEAPMSFMRDEPNYFKGSLPNQYSYGKGTDAFKGEVKKAAYDYYHLTKDPRYLERVRALENELGMKGELERRLKLYQQQGEEDLGKELPFNIKIKKLSTDDSWGGSTVRSGIVNQLTLKEMTGKMRPEEIQHYLNTHYFSPQEREIVISPVIQKPNTSMSIEDIVWHEKKHHWLNNLKDEQGGIQKYADWLSSSKTGQVDAYLMDIPKEYYNYHTNPSELDAYLMTNLRNELVRKKYLKDHFDLLSEQKLNDFINDNLQKNKGDLSLLVKKYFAPGKELIGDKKQFINVFNKALPIGAGVTIGAKEMSDQRKMGGRVPALPVVGVF
jgi:hypothetical protein